MEEEPGLVDIAFEQLEFLRHAPTKAKTFEEIDELCKSVRKEYDRSPVLVRFLANFYFKAGCLDVIGSV